MKQEFKIEGIEAVSNEIKSLGKDKMKRREILKILRRQADPIKSKMKQNAPESDNVIIVRGDVYYPGNLKKAIAIKTSRSKKYPNVLIGPRYGKGAKKNTMGFMRGGLSLQTEHINQTQRAAKILFKKHLAKLITWSTQQ